MEAGVFQPGGGQPLGRGGVDRTAEGAGGAEADIVEQDDQDVGGTGGWPQRLDRRKPGGGILGIVGRQPNLRPIRDRQDLTRKVVSMATSTSFTPRVEESSRCFELAVITRSA